MPQSVKLPTAVVGDPDFKKDVDYYPDQSDNFFVGNSFPTCGINFTAQEIMKQTADDREMEASDVHHPSASIRARAAPSPLDAGGLTASRVTGQTAKMARGANRRRSSAWRTSRSATAACVALDNANLAIRRARSMRSSARTAPGKSTLIKIMAGVVAPDERANAARRPRGALPVADRGQRRRHRLHLPGTVADPRPLGRRQHPDHPTRRAASA